MVSRKFVDGKVLMKREKSKPSCKLFVGDIIPWQQELFKPWLSTYLKMLCEIFIILKKKEYKRKH